MTAATNTTDRDQQRRRLSTPPAGTNTFGHEVKAPGTTPPGATPSDQISWRQDQHRRRRARRTTTRPRATPRALGNTIGRAPAPTNTLRAVVGRAARNTRRSHARTESRRHAGATAGACPDRATPYVRAGRRATSPRSPGATPSPASVRTTPPAAGNAVSRWATSWARYVPSPRNIAAPRATPAGRILAPSNTRSPGATPAHREQHPTVARPRRAAPPRPADDKTAPSDNAATVDGRARAAQRCHLGREQNPCRRVDDAPDLSFGPCWIRP